MTGQYGEPRLRRLIFRYRPTCVSGRYMRIQLFYLKSLWLCVSVVKLLIQGVFKSKKARPIGDRAFFTGYFLVLVGVGAGSAGASTAGSTGVPAAGVGSGVACFNICPVMGMKNTPISLRECTRPWASFR